MSRSAAPLGSLRSPRRAAERKSGHFTCSENRTFYLLPTHSAAFSNPDMSMNGPVEEPGGECEGEG